MVEQQLGQDFLNVKFQGGKNLGFLFKMRKRTVGVAGQQHL